MGGITLAWAAGMGIIVYRSFGTDHRPPVPGQLLAATGLFALMALLAEYPPARTTATAFAFGIDVAVLMKVLPGSKAPAAAPKTKAAQAAASTPQEA